MARNRAARHRRRPDPVGGVHVCLASTDGRRRRRAARTWSFSDRPASQRAARHPIRRSSTDRVATALAGLRLVDVRPANDAVRGKPAATATYRTFDGLVLAIDGYTEGDKRYVRVKPSVDETAARRFFVAPAAPADKDGAADSAPPKPLAHEASGGKSTPATSPESVVAQTREEATKLETRLTGWSFEIPSWSYDAIFASSSQPQ